VSRSRYLHCTRNKMVGGTGNGEVLTFSGVCILGGGDRVSWLASCNFFCMISTVVNGHNCSSLE
jgi:6-phosphogluconate dehydrogenase